MSSRSVVKLIHADGFFSQEGAIEYCNIVKNLNFTQKDYGYEIENFNMILTDIEPVFSKIIGERIIVDSAKSGVFRRPINNTIHFESFETLNEWCFIVALEKTTLNLWHHIKNHGDGEVSPVDAETALDGYKFNYRNLFEWIIHTNIVLNPGQGVFIRPWVFRSLEDGMIQYYRLISDKKFRVLVMGLPNSGRKEVALKLKELIPNSKLLESKSVREQEKDIDFSYDGKMRHIYRMLDLARESKEDYVIIDMVCPLKRMREILNPDIVIWVNNGDINSVDIEFEKPNIYDFKFDKNYVDYEQILERIKTKNYNA